MNFAGVAGVVGVLLQRLRAASGSLFAWHGSWWGNWHSIVRNGLKVLSNTKYMSAGAAYGTGIYFADDLATSAGYSSNYSPSSRSWEKSEFVGSMCFALCEVRTSCRCR